jgi:hypothetical protein
VSPSGLLVFPVRLFFFILVSRQFSSFDPYRRRVEVPVPEAKPLTRLCETASGKSTLACALELELLQKGKRAFRLDGDNVRFGLNKDLGFSPKDREENIRRVGEVRPFPPSLSLSFSPFRALLVPF